MLMNVCANSLLQVSWKSIVYKAVSLRMTFCHSGLYSKEILRVILSVFEKYLFGSVILAPTSLCGGQERADPCCWITLLST